MVPITDIDKILTYALKDIKLATFEYMYFYLKKAQKQMEFGLLLDCFFR